MKKATQSKFDPQEFLAKVGEGRTIGTYAAGHPVFHQGDPAAVVFYLQDDEVKLTVVSEQGKEAVVALLTEPAFFGEGCLAGQTKRMATAITMTESVIVGLERSAIVRIIQQEPAFSELFIAHLLQR